MTHPDLARIRFLVGTWQGSGHGDYPSITAFDYDEEVVIDALPKPVLAYRQRTSNRADGSPLHSEFGFIRLPEGNPELVICQPTGIVEAHSGTLDGQAICWDSRTTAMTPSAEVHRVTKVRREVTVDGDTMHYRLWMAAVGEPLQVHLEATLTRVAD